MTESSPETRSPAHGQISYLELPAQDGEQSAAFYETVFGWQVRGEESERSFTAPGGLLGRWVVAPTTMLEERPVIYVSVDSVDETLRLVRASGGQVLRSPYAEGDLRVATFRDPGGNAIGVWQHGLR